MIDSKYIKYANDVLEEKIVTCKWIKLACKRYLEWFNREDIEFRCDKADHAVNFIEKLKHYAGKCAGKQFLLEEWQKFVVYNIFGWYYKGTNKRVTKKVLLFCARKVGKTMFGAAIALYVLIGDGVPGTQMLNVANNHQQAHLLFTMEQELIKGLDPKHKYFKVTRDKIMFAKKKSYAQVLSSDATGLDGFGGSFIADETHQYRDSQLWDVLISGQGYIESPLAMQITTAGFLIEGFLYKYTETCKDILNNRLVDDTQFSMIFTLDEGDDWKDENVWIKSNPNLNVTVDIEYLREQVRSAINNPSLEVGVKTKNFNMFCQSQDVWIPNDLLKQQSKKFSLLDIKNRYIDDILECFVGVDLAATRDLVAVTALVQVQEKFYFKNWSFIAEEALENSGQNKSLYEEARRGGYLIVTPGSVTDYDYVTELIEQINEVIPIVNIAYDRALSGYWGIRFEESHEDIPLLQYSQTIFNFGQPTLQLERMVFANNDTFVLDDNPLIRWQFSNCVIKEDMIGNKKPMKENKASAKKIDNVITMLEALGSWMLQYGQSVTYAAFSVDKQQ